MSKKLFVLMAVLAMLPWSYVSAAQIKIPPDSGNVVVESTENDVYTAGASVTQNGTLAGDLVAAGGTVTQTGTVKQDVMAAGGTVSIVGTVEGDARLAGGTVILNAPIGEDLLVAGGTISLSESARVGNDLLAAGGNLSISAEVGGDAQLVGGEILINSRIAGNVDVQAQRLVFGPRAQVSGKITYRGEQQPVIQQGAVVSPIEFIKVTRPAPSKEWISVFSVTSFFVAMVALFLAALFLWKVGPGTVTLLLQNAERSPWKNLGIGFLGVIVTPIALILLLVTVIGSYIAGILGFIFASTLLIAYAVGPLFVGALLMKWIKKTPTLTLSWSALVLGVIIFSLLRIIPFVGWLLSGAIALLIFGGIVCTLYSSMRRSGSMGARA